MVESSIIPEHAYEDDEGETHTIPRLRCWLIICEGDPGPLLIAFPDSVLADLEKMGCTHVAGSRDLCLKMVQAVVASRR